MNWVMYLIKTPLVQVRQDWAEYKALKGQIVQAESDVSHSRGRITLMYDIDDDISWGDACLKRKMILDQGDGACDVVNPQFIVSRCKYFAPEGKEEICACRVCGKWPANNRYCTDLAHLKELMHKRQTFWSQKHAKVK